MRKPDTFDHSAKVIAVFIVLMAVAVTLALDTESTDRGSNTRRKVGDGSDFSARDAL